MGKVNHTRYSVSWSFVLDKVLGAIDELCPDKDRANRIKQCLSDEQSDISIVLSATISVVLDVVDAVANATAGGSNA